MADLTLENHHCRKVIKVGCSTAIVIPPHVLDHIGVVVGDYIIYDLNVRNFAVVSRAPVPPYVSAPAAEDEATTDAP